jgi:hypothetical protein
MRKSIEHIGPTKQPVIESHRLRIAEANLSERQCAKKAVFIAARIHTAG